MGRPKGSKNKLTPPSGDAVIGGIVPIPISVPVSNRSSSRTSQNGSKNSSTGSDHQETADSEPRGRRGISTGEIEEAIAGGDARRTPRGKRTTGQVVLDEIGQEFASLREKGGRSEAWAALQSKLMRNLGNIVPDAASLEQCISLSLKIEDFRKSEQAHGKAPGDVLSEWLRSGDASDAA